jgi:hypothetical protein
MARDVLNHPVQAQINDFYNYLRGVESGRLAPSFRSPRPGLELNVDDLDDYLLDIEAATVVGGWDALATESGASPASADGRRRAFIQAYFREYFRNGQFFEFSLTPGARRPGQGAAEASFRCSTTRRSRELVDTVLKDYLNLKRARTAPTANSFVRSARDRGFVTRGGRAISFRMWRGSIRPRIGKSR